MFRRRAALTLAAGYAAFAVLVAAGALTRVDQWAVDHVLVRVPGAGGPPTLLEAAVPAYHVSWNDPFDVVATLVTLPAQALLASLLLGACCLVWWRRGDRSAALAWVAGWVAANAVEVLCKSLLARPLLHGHGLPLDAFRSSFPSGHTLRAVLLATAAASLRPALRAWVAAWAAAVLLLLVLDGLHVPSDVAGGLLLAALVAVLVRGTVSASSR